MMTTREKALLVHGCLASTYIETMKLLNSPQEDYSADLLFHYLRGLCISLEPVIKNAGDVASEIA